MSDLQELRLKRLRWQAQHRGCKETDLVLGRFADRYLLALDEESLGVFEQLLDEDDADIWDWLVRRYAPANLVYEPLLERLRQFSAEH